MKIRAKITGAFLGTITVAVFLFLIFCYYMIHHGYYSGVNAYEIRRVLGEAETRFEQVDMNSRKEIINTLKTLENQHPKMYLALLKDEVWLGNEGLPQITDPYEIMNIVTGQTNTLEGYKVSARAMKKSDEQFIILCYVPLENMEALSYEINMVRGKGIFGKLALVGMLLTLVLMEVFLWLGSKKFFKRLAHMNEVIASFSQEHMDGRMATEGKDEISIITKTFNEMADRLKRGYEEKELYENSRKQLVSDISHDLRTPLSSILGYAEMLQNNIYESKEEARQFIDIIHRKAQYMNQLLNELLEYSRLELGTLTLNKQPMDIVEILRQILIEYIPTMEKNQYTLSIDLPEQKIIGEWDEVRLRRVVHNIMDNALKYGMDGKRIKVQLKEGQHQVILKIKDYGKGIAAEDLKQIRRRFYRSDLARNSKIGGMGLGMYIADEIIRLHEGEFWIESKIGEGTCVTMKLKKN